MPLATIPFNRARRVSCHLEAEGFGHSSINGRLFNLAFKQGHVRHSAAGGIHKHAVWRTAFLDGLWIVRHEETWLLFTILGLAKQYLALRILPLDSHKERSVLVLSVITLRALH